MITFYQKIVPCLRQPVSSLRVTMVYVIWGAALLYAVAGTIIFNAWGDRANQKIENLGFGYGALVESIQERGEYRVCNVHHEEICFSAHRLPFIPYSAIIAANVVGNDLARLTWLKSLVWTIGLASLLHWVSRRTRVSIGFFAFGALALVTMPRWAITFFELSVEEAYLSLVLAWVVALGLFTTANWWQGNKAGCIIGGLLVILLGLKHSMPFLCLATPFLLWWCWGNTRTLIITTVIVLVAIAGLMTFNGIHSQKWTIGSSWAGWNLYKGNNVQTAAYYPQYSLDLLDYEGGVTFDRQIIDEWDYDHYLKEKAVEFIRQNPIQFLELSLLKAWVFFAEIRPTGAMRDQQSLPAQTLKQIQMVWMLAFRALFIWVAWRCCTELVQRSWHDRHFRQILFCFGLFVLYSGFYIVGFAYERHIVPIMLPTLLIAWWLAQLNTPQNAQDS